jgi:carboxypeptidase B
MAVWMCGLLCLCAFVHAGAAPPDGAIEQPVRYDDFKQVAVDVGSEADWNLVRSLSVDLWSPHTLSLDLEWSDGMRPDRVEVLMSPEGFERFEDSGLSFQVLDDDVQSTIESSMQAGVSGGPFDDWMDYNAVLAYMDSLVALRPDLVTRFDIGLTLQGRPIVCFKITGPGGGNKPAVLYHGLEHAREWITIPVTIYIADQLVRNYDQNAQYRALVNRAEWYIIPVFNVDGYLYTWSTNRLWRKNLRGGYGVDINRNWGYQWGGPGSSGNQNDETYRGASPFSEPETQVMRDFILDHPNLVAHLDIHSYGPWCLWPWGWSPNLIPDDPEFRAVGNNMVDIIRAVHGVTYRPGPVYGTLYPAAGVSLDWVYNEYGILTYTFELRGPNFTPPPSAILPNCEELFPGVLYLTEHATTAVKIEFPNGLPNLLPPSESVDLTVDIIPGAESVDPNGAMLHLRTDPNGAFEEYPIQLISGNRFRATFPARDCGNDTEYYVSAQGTGGGTSYSPSGAPDDLYRAPVGVLEVAFEDDFQTNKGWTAVNLGATSGDWQRGVPVNDSGWDYDPASDGDGSGSCYLTLNQPGNTDVDDGAVQLSSPQFDLTGGGNISYYYFHNLTREQDNNDLLLAEINNNGGSGAWTQIARHNTSGGLNWRTNTITEQELANLGVTFTDRMVVRFTANDANQQSIVESGVDGFTVATVTCESGDVIAPSEFEVIRGVHTGGTIDELLDSDDEYVQVEARLPDEVAAPSAQIEIRGTSPIASPTVLTFVVEAASSGSPAEQQIELYDFVSSSWVMLDARGAPSNDTVVTVTVNVNAGRYVDDGTLEVRARVGYGDRGVTFPAWGGRYDRAYWTVSE